MYVHPPQLRLGHGEPDIRRSCGWRGVGGACQVGNGAGAPSIVRHVRARHFWDDLVAHARVAAAFASARENADAASCHQPEASSEQPAVRGVASKGERERACARAIFEAETCWAPAPGPAVAAAGLWAQAFVAALLVSSPGRFQRRRAIPLRQTAVAARQAAVARRVTELITEDRLTLPCKHGHGRSSGPSGRVFTRSRIHSDCADL